MNARVPAVRNQALVGFGVFALALWAAYRIGGEVAANDVRTLEFIGLGGAGIAIALATLRNWRTGFYLFFVWMIFEDLVRKYMGNNLVLFFGKDVLLALIYVALFREIRRKREKTFRPPFLLFLSLFVWLGVFQIFNQNSPHILYGLLGFKVYFYYVPLMFVGYALIRTDDDLRKLLVLNAVIAGFVAALGIVQAIVGNQFLNPAVMAPEIEDLSNISKVSPISNQGFTLPASVFVSSGRFAAYLTIGFIFATAAAAYLLLHTRRNRKLIFVAIGILGMATLLSGSRSAMVSVVASAAILSAGFLWAAPWRWRQAHRLIKAIRRSFVIAALGLAALILLFPQEAGSRIAFYVETLSPNSSAYELGGRTWDYPISNFLGAFTRPNWVMGNGIGTASLGGQYVAKLIGQPPPGIWVEEGYGNLIVEMGVIAPLLWILWSGALLYYCWKIVRRLRETRLAPIALAITWYAFLLLYIWTYGALSGYQNYIDNIFLWLSVGMLFRLPDLLNRTAGPVAVPLAEVQRDE